MLDTETKFCFSSSGLGRGGSSQRGRTTKVSAPQPVNLPSRRHERAGNDSLGSSSHSWGSPSTNSSTGLATSPSTTSPVTENVSNVPASGNPAGQGTTDSPQPDTSNGLPSQKPTPRAWGAVAQTPEQSPDDFPTAAEAAKKLQEQNGEFRLLSVVSLLKPCSGY